MAFDPEAKIRYIASNMILNIHSYASYLSVPKAIRRARVYFYPGYKTYHNKVKGDIHKNSKMTKM